MERHNVLGWSVFEPQIQHRLNQKITELTNNETNLLDAVEEDVDMELLLEITDDEIDVTHSMIDLFDDPIFDETLGNIQWA